MHRCQFPIYLSAITVTFDLPLIQYMIYINSILCMYETYLAQTKGRDGINKVYLSLYVPFIWGGRGTREANYSLDKIKDNFILSSLLKM